MPSSFKARRAPVALALVTAALALPAVLSVRPAAAPAGGPGPLALSDSFVVDGADGYGTSDCLGAQGACGRVVADALCATRGLARSLTWRAATPDDVTASTGLRATARDLYVVSCGRA